MIVIVDRDNPIAAGTAPVESPPMGDVRRLDGDIGAGADSAIRGRLARGRGRRWIPSPTMATVARAPGAAR